MHFKYLRLPNMIKTLVQDVETINTYHQFDAVAVKGITVLLISKIVAMDNLKLFYVSQTMTESEYFHYLKRKENIDHF